MFFTPDEAAQIIGACEERLLAAGTIKERFTPADIQGGILKDHLLPDDYLVPQKVSNIYIVLVSCVAIRQKCVHFPVNY